MDLRNLDTGLRVADQVFDVLLDAIIGGDYAPGHRLRIRDLASELGTSVMPVRESLRRLEEMGLTVAEPYKGSVVKEFTATELLWIYSVRRLLEVEATRLGISQMRNAELEELRVEFEKLQDAVATRRAGDYLEHDENLLNIIYSAADNPVLLETIQSLWLRCAAYKNIGARREMAQGDPATLVSFQRALLDAAVHKDVDAGIQATEASIDAAITRVRNAFIR